MHSDTNLPKLKVTKNRRIHLRSPSLHLADLSYRWLYRRLCKNLGRDGTRENHVFPQRPAESLKYMQRRTYQQRELVYFTEMWGKELPFPVVLLSPKHLLHIFSHKIPTKWYHYHPSLFCKWAKEVEPGRAIVKVTHQEAAGSKVCLILN